MIRHNDITDIAGLTAGHATDARLKSGVTVVLCDRPMVASVVIQGAAPATRETDLLQPWNTVEAVDAIVLSGGSAYGLDAAGGVQGVLRERGRGFRVGPVTVPIVPQASLFDLINGGDKSWGDPSPYQALGRAAALAAGPGPIAQGSVGAGTGALTATVKGGLGSASALTSTGHRVAALAAVNPVGTVTVGDTAHFWAALFERGDEFGGLGVPSSWPEAATDLRLKGHARRFAQAPASTTLVIVATDAALTKPECHRLATMAHDGLARAILPAHTPMDGDIVFALSTGAQPLSERIVELAEIGHVAALTVARAIARGVHAATPALGDPLPTWAMLRDRLL
jgi:L-aminopeptidase/D-esterase-like protein